MVKTAWRLTVRLSGFEILNNPGAPGKFDPRGLHFAHKNVQIDLLCKKFKTWSNRTGLFTIDWQTINETFYRPIRLFGGDPFDVKRVQACVTKFWLKAARNMLLGSFYS